MENDSSRRNRLMKKFFHGKDSKPDGTQQTDLDDFLHTSSSDTLDVTHPVPPPPVPSSRVLPKLNISNASRYPQALALDQPNQGLPIRPPPHSPGLVSNRRPVPNRKGQLVRFVDSWPDIIGEGGDECPDPTIEVSRRKSKRNNAPPPPPSPRNPARLAQSQSDLSDKGRSTDSLAPPPSQHLQPGSPLPPGSSGEQRNILTPGNAASSRYLDTSRPKDENRRSFIEIQQAEMRQAEGRAFAEAARSGSATSERSWDESSRQDEQSPQKRHESPRFRSVQPTVDAGRDQYYPSQHGGTQSPTSLNSTSSSVYSQPSSLTQGSVSRQGSLVTPMMPAQPPASPNAFSFSRQASVLNQQDPFGGAHRSQSVRMHDVVQAAAEDALNTFVARVRHLFELFRLHAEAVRPISSSAPDQFSRASLWWFIKGRMGLEMVIRSRDVPPQSQMQLEMDRQQAYANLAKGYWISELAIPELLEARNLRLGADEEDARQALLSNLRKLTISMKRNNLLPPEEAFLPQTIDKSIWVEYPALSQDVVALLTGAAGSGMTMTQHTGPQMSIIESLPLGDVGEYFNYSRIAVDAYLMEQGMESQRVTLPCLLSTIRPQNQSSLSFILSSQSGQVQLRIQSNKSLGPTWDDVRWVPEANVLDVRLPRGFKLDIHCSRQDFTMLWSMYDFGRKVQATLYPRSDELVTFRSTLPAFEYLDADPQSRSFPKDAQMNCEVALFEKVYKESVAGGTRCLHRGCRLAVVTGPQTRTLSGVNHAYVPTQPIQFTFLRGNSGLPALHMRFDNGRQKGHMVLSFHDEKERLEFHMIFTGARVANDELVVAKVPIAGFKITQKLGEAEGVAGLEKCPWATAKIINEENEGDDPRTVLSDRMRVWMDFNVGTITDRVNMAPGEFKLRLEVGNPKVLHILRQPQQDLTVALSESHVSKDACASVHQGWQILSKTQSVRSYTFHTLEDLHMFQEGMTGFKVLFDAVATSFAIARRRMVVPIHKKWEAGRTRIQVVQQDKIMQMLVFFEDFHHGHCMGFVLKGTDVFEVFGRSSKAGLRIVDAKFPLPRVDDGRGGAGGEPNDVAFIEIRSANCFHHP
ncbi:hypothetical protein SAPIO_CDS3311 [Scedosporium apiospermum]|uniref:Uncharacterized protein n=1 Tax=Pseudallescheria apiosperma TaxID=563466 RepID=A0A084GAH4_PSEDA|nr:uncharacterized protein SAPIO_CDS3311 [Scedosporium apiospermum]KEZ44336.1 hypothetical protein SAPIO_CDS3311 [Scedosporium apiospermum]